MRAGVVAVIGAAACVWNLMPSADAFCFFSFSLRLSLPTLFRTDCYNADLLQSYFCATCVACVPKSPAAAALAVGSCTHWAGAAAGLQHAQVVRYPKGNCEPGRGRTPLCPPLLRVQPCVPEVHQCCWHGSWGSGISDLLRCCCLLPLPRLGLSVRCQPGAPHLCLPDLLQPLCRTGSVTAARTVLAGMRLPAGRGCEPGRRHGCCLAQAAGRLRFVRQVVCEPRCGCGVALA